MDLGDEKYWEKNEGSLEELKKTVLEHIQYAYAKYELADALGIELKKENRNNVNSLLKEYKAASNLIFSRICALGGYIYPPKEENK